MRNKDVTIVKYLIEKKNEELNIRIMSKELGMDYKNVYVIIKRLEKGSIIRLEPFGQSSRVKLISQVHPLIFEAEYNRKKEILKDKNLAVMLNNFKDALKSKWYILLLFGSYAKKTQTKNSDIDVMLIVPDGKEDLCEKDADRAARSLPLQIHILVFSESQFLEMLQTKQSNVGQEALKNNIILYGGQIYLQLLEEAIQNGLTNKLVY